MKEPTKRYYVKCHTCTGTGWIDEGVDADGQGHLGRCRCYRGSITIKLTHEDEIDLAHQLRSSLGECCADPDAANTKLRDALHRACDEAVEGYSRGWDRLDQRDAMARLSLIHI